MICLMILEVSLCLGNGRVGLLAEIIHSSPDLFHKLLLNPNNVPDTVLGTRDTGIE